MIFSIATKLMGVSFPFFLNHLTQMNQKPQNTGLNFASSPIFCPIEYTFGPKPNHHRKPGPRLLISSDMLRYCCWQGKQKFSSWFAQYQIKTSTMVSVLAQVVLIHSLKKLHDFSFQVFSFSKFTYGFLWFTYYYQ